MKIEAARNSLTNLIANGKITSTTSTDIFNVRTALNELEEYQNIFEKYNIKSKSDLIGILERQNNK